MGRGAHIDGLNEATRLALDRSVFQLLPAHLLSGILTGSRTMVIPGGQRLMPRDLPGPFRCGVVTGGLLRLYLASADGRQITFRYAGAGYFLGASTTVVSPSAFPPSGIQAVTTASILLLDHENLKAQAHKEAAICWALLEQAVIYQLDIARLMAGTAFGSITQRTAMHLLNLATADETGSLVAPVTQQVLADAVGTTRETVARALGELRAAGIVATVSGGVLLREPERLAEILEPAAGL